MTRGLIKDPAEFGRVAVAMGGDAAEREVSIKSGTEVLTALLNRGVDAVKVDINDDLVGSLTQESFDRVFNIVHGRGGEDGVMQGILEALKIPYTGSRVMASALCMDKLRTKWCLQGAGLQTPPWFLFNGENDIDQCIAELGFPVMVKPAKEGSSFGMSKAEDRPQLVAAYQLAAEFDCDVYAEAWVEGDEYTVALLAGLALPTIRLETPNAFYDYEAKYEADTTQYHCPCGLSDEHEQQLQSIALKACNVAGVTGWGRVDLFIDKSGDVQLIEINTVPGMTDHSLVPMAAKANGIEFDELVWRILETSKLDKS